MTETDRHRKNMTGLIEALDLHFADEEQIYISGNLFVYYVPGNKLKHVSPDVFVVRGVPRGNRDYYLVWEEKKTPDLVIELTSRSTKGEDMDDKFVIYRDTLKVKEYFLFDPNGEYLKPQLKGYRLSAGRYVPIKAIKGRLPSQVLELHLQRVAWELRLFDPGAGRFLLTPQEALFQAELKRQRAEARSRQVKKEIEELRRQLKATRRNSHDRT